MKFTEVEIRRIIETTDRLTNKNAELWVANLFESFDITPSLQYMNLCVPYFSGTLSRHKAASND